jgi:hypothetical protein
MPQVIEIPGVGEVEFPDEMGDAEILAAVKKLSGPQAPPLASSHEGRAPYEPPKTGRLESGARGALQGASMGWADEGAAAIDAALPSFLRNETSARAVAPGLSDVVAGNTADTWRERFGRAREFYRNRNATAEASNPGTYLAGQVGGAAAPALIGGAPLTGAKGLLVAAGQGAAQGAGYSEDEGLGLARDTALGGGLGVAGHGVGTLVGKGAAWAGRAGRELVRSGTARAGAQAAKEVTDEIASAAGKVGGEVQKGSRQVENLMRLEAAMTPQQRALYAQLEAQGIVPALQQSVAQGTLDALPGQAGTIAARQAELAALQSAAPQAAAQRTAALLKPQVKTDVKSFLKAYAEPMAWAVGGQQVGSALGLDPAAQGALAGAAGLVGGRTRAGKALWTRLNRPAHQTAAGRALENLSSAATGSRAEALRRLMEAGVPAAGIAAIVEGE